MQPLLRVLLVLALASLATRATAAAGRDTLSFDYGWLHRTGLHAAAGPDDRPPAKPDPGLDPAEAAPGFDDSSWQPVQVRSH